MTLEMVKATMLADNIHGFIQFVYKQDYNNNIYLSHPDKLYRLKLLVEEFKLQVIADELHRINRFVYDEKYTSLLVGRFKKALAIIGEYIENNHDDLFIFTARLHILQSMCSGFWDKVSVPKNAIF